jgi:type IV pilus assembly protein PilA
MGANQISQGFTLLELMIVVAIIGTLASIAVPAYQAYIAKSQLAEAFELVGTVKALISDYYGQTSSWPANGTAGIPSATSISGRYVQRVSVSNVNGEVTVTMRASGVSSPLLGQSLTFTPSVASASVLIIQWACTTPIKQTYVPIAACQGS